MAYEGLAESLLNTRTNVKQKAEANQAIAQAKSPMFNFGEQFADVYSKSTAPVTAANTADEIGHEYTIDPMREELARKLGNEEWNSTFENFNKSFNRLRELEAAKENKLYNAPAVKSQKIVEVPEANVDVPGLIKKNSANININNLKTITTGWPQDDKRWDILNSALQQGKLQKVQGGWYVGPANKGATITDDVLNSIVKASNIVIPTTKQTITEEVKPGGFEGLTPDQIDEKINFWRRELEKHRKNINTKIPGRSELADLVELKLKEDELAARKRSGGGSDKQEGLKFKALETSLNQRVGQIEKLGLPTSVKNNYIAIVKRINGSMLEDSREIGGKAIKFADDLENRLPNIIDKNNLTLIDNELKNEINAATSVLNDPNMTDAEIAMRLNSILVTMAPAYSTDSVADVTSQLLADRLISEVFNNSQMSFNDLAINPADAQKELDSTRSNFKSLVLNYIKENKDPNKITEKDLTSLSNVYKVFRDKMNNEGKPIAKEKRLFLFNRPARPEKYLESAREMLNKEFKDFAPTQEALRLNQLTPENKAWVELFKSVNDKRSPGESELPSAAIKSYQESRSNLRQPN